MKGGRQLHHSEGNNRQEPPTNPSWLIRFWRQHSLTFIDLEKEEIGR